MTRECAHVLTENYEVIPVSPNWLLVFSVVIFISISYPMTSILRAQSACVNRIVCAYGAEPICGARMYKPDKHAWG